MASKVQQQLEPWSHLDGKIVMVTGASFGIGLEFCLDIARASCKIVAAARRVDLLESLCDQINNMDVLTGDTNGGSGQAIPVVLDVRANGPAIEACIERSWNAFGRIDVLINNAGVGGEKISTLKFPEEEFNRVNNTNFRGAWLVSKYVGARMRDDGRGGSIINISSVSALDRTQSHGSIAYGPSKVALDSMTKTMALELGCYNIRVNTIVPGIFISEITKDLFKKSWAKSVIEKITPLKSTGTIDPAITTLLRYLIHDSSSFISGNIFIADAGLYLPGIPLYSSL